MYRSSAGTFTTARLSSPDRVSTPADKLAAHSADLCMDTTDGVAVHGTVLQIWQCYGGNQNQQFTISGSMQ